MTHAPRLPREQPGDAEGAEPSADAREPGTGLRTGRPGEADVALDGPGRFGDLKQNLTNQWKVQTR